MYPRNDPVTGRPVYDPLADGFWTPGERFTDQPRPNDYTAPNRAWDDYFHAEDTWTPDHSGATGIVQQLAMDPGFRAFIGSAQTGDLFADYSLNTRTDTNAPARVTGTSDGLNMVLPGVTIYIADIARGTNVPFRINELDLTPPRYFNNGVPVYGVDQFGTDITVDQPPVLEGDAAHTYVRDNTTPPANTRPTYASVPALSRFEYNTSAANGQPFVYFSGYTIEVLTWVSRPLTLNALANPGVDVGGVMLDPTQGLIITATNRTWTLVHRGTNDMIAESFPYATVRIPVYYASPIWGAPAAGTYTNPISIVAPVVPMINIFNDAIGQDDEPTAAILAEPFDDFLAFWDPTGGPNGNGAWISGLVGTPAGDLGAVGPGSSAWTYTDYTNYIQNNYPGNWVGRRTGATTDPMSGRKSRTTR
jgi:hypothetical protein